MRISTRSSSTTCLCPTTCCSETRPAGGTPPSPPWPKRAWPSGGGRHCARAAALRVLASQPGPDRDDALRELGELDAYTNAIKALGVRETIRLLDGQESGPASSIAKVAMNVLLRRTFEATLQLAVKL